MENSFTHFKRIILIVSLTFIAYSNSFDSEFHFDDYTSIITHPYIRSIDNIPGFYYYKGAPLVGRPVTMTTFAINYKIGRLNPFSYHHINFLIHLANVILIYVLLSLTLKNRVNDYINVSLLTSLMFAVHPIQTQAVTYIVQRAEILSAFFYLLALVLFVKARLVHSSQFIAHSSEPTNYELRATNLQAKACGYTLYAVSLISAVLALGSKEVAVTLPATILLYDFFFISNGDVRALVKKWPVHLLFLLTLLPLMYFIGLSQFKTFISTSAVKPPPTASVYVDTPLISRYEYLLTQFRVIWTYIRLLILPVNQNLDYNYPVSNGLLKPLTTLFGGLGIIMLLAFAVFIFKRQRLISFFIFWFFIILVPTSFFAVLPDVIFEHRVYLSSPGYFVIFTMGIFKVSDILFKRIKEL